MVDSVVRGTMAELMRDGPRYHKAVEDAKADVERHKGMGKGREYGVCKCCRDDHYGSVTLAECDGCRRMVCKGCLAYLYSEYLCCECRGSDHVPEDYDHTSADERELWADQDYHSDKDEGKVG